MTTHIEAPYLHDRWEDEVALEREMLALGESRMRDKINKAREKRDMNRLRPYRSLLKEWVIPVSDGIQGWIGKMAAKRGPKPLSLAYIRTIDPDTLSVVTLKCVLRLLGVEVRKVISIAVEIGTWAEHEARAAAWAEKEPEDWKALQAYQRKRGSTAPHQRRSRVVLFNKFIRDKIGWDDWTDEVRMRVGLDLLDIAASVTKRFHIVGDPAWRPRKSKPTKRPLIVEPDHELVAWLSGAMDDELLFWPVYMPTLIPPKPWASARSGDGGYWTPFAKSPYLIRFNAMSAEQKRGAVDEYDAVDMSEVYAAVNSIQNTAWAINRRVYDVAKMAWDNDLALAGMPRKEAEFVPPRPEEANSDPLVHKMWARQVAPIRTRNATRFSKFIAAMRCMRSAEKFLDEPAFYFPHMLDFRGRMYPIPSDLHPQGDDLHRGLLTFARGKPVGDEDAGWIAVHLANCWGVDKVSFDARIAWVEERAAMWLSIDVDPMGDMRWLEADDPWQALAAVFEWARWLREGAGMVSSLPVRVDGTCNGLQHLSAMVRDPVGGAAVNLVPDNHPHDIYIEVANRLTEELQRRQGEEELAGMWLRVFNGHAPRTITKRPVMILPYGGTREAYFQYTWEWLAENDPHHAGFKAEERAKAVRYLVNILWSAVSARLGKAVEVMTWLKASANIAASTGAPLYWRTPSGFLVRHFYGERDSRRIETRIDGQRLQLWAKETSDKLDRRAQLKGIAPNFVHSMDAAALVLSTNLAFDNGIDALTAVHDAYGTVAADMWKLTACIRQAFVGLYSEPVLGQFLQACRDVYPEATTWPEPPATGDLNIEDVMQSDYFFA